jgi:glutathione S-transferase
MMQLFQAEWCPSSQDVRQRLTELCVDYVIRQVPVDRVDRCTLRAATGSDVIPARLLEDGTALSGKHAVCAYLDGHVPETAAAAAHRAKAERIRRGQLSATGAPIPVSDPAFPAPLEVSA